MLLFVSMDLAAYSFPSFFIFYAITVYVFAYRYINFFLQRLVNTVIRFNGLLAFLQIRHILENGSLYFPKFDATAFRQDVHWTVYKCIASNAGGTIISRDLSIKAGKKQKFNYETFLSLLLSLHVEFSVKMI